ncbi:hypothetical protein LCGC14_0549660 [marine sediment metagenome]|uniref:HTH cro/C1-type domain-containing protein n=1 Tax=marine sediment metagenome TaxID=412755 RepID=A0A0F9RV30_9ZZZZ
MKEITELRRKVKSYMKKNKISYREFGKLCNVPHTTIHLLVTEGKNFQFDSAIKVIKVLGSFEINYKRKT